MELLNAIVYAVISGIVGGSITGVAAFTAIRVEMKYLRRDVDHAHRLIQKIREEI